MASFVVAWSVKNVLCGLVCLAALVLTGRKYATVEDTTTSNLQELLDQMHETLGARQDDTTRVVDKSVVESVEAWMAPSFAALPKRGHRLQTLAAKHLLHTYFNSQYGLNLEGLQFYNSQREPNAQALADLALVKRSPKLKTALQDSTQSYSLSELARIATLLHRLVLKEIRITFKVAWRLRNHSASAELTMEELQEVFCSALIVAHDWDQVIITSESLKKGAPSVLHDRFRIGQDFATGHLKYWLRLRKFVKRLSRRTLKPAPFYSFKTALPTYLALYTSYGTHQNNDCQDMKSQLQPLESSGSGRLPLNAVQNEHGWFREYPSLVGYLHKLETLATYYAKSPAVVVTNFVDGSHNCVSANSNFAMCCMSECTSVLRVYEKEVKAPEASPAELLRITTTSMPYANLTDELVVRLHKISALTGGKVHLHGRLFAEWLHVLVPYQCPWPNPRWEEDDQAHMSNAAIGGTEVPMESWYSESMRDLQRLLDDGLWPDTEWSDEEVLPSGAGMSEELLKPQCETSMFHLIVQIVVIAAGLNDLVWLCQWWKLPEGEADAKQKEEELLSCETSSKSTPASKGLQQKGSTTAKKDNQQKAPKKGKDAKGSSKGVGKEKGSRIEHLQASQSGSYDASKIHAINDRDLKQKSTEEEEAGEDSSTKVGSRSSDSDEEVTIVSRTCGTFQSSDQGRSPDADFGSAMSKAAARVATSRAAAAAAVAAVTELQAATAPEARSLTCRSRELMSRAGRLLTRRQVTRIDTAGCGEAVEGPGWRCSTVIPSSANL